MAQRLFRFGLSTRCRAAGWRMLRSGESEGCVQGDDREPLPAKGRGRLNDRLLSMRIESLQEFGLGRSKGVLAGSASQQNVSVSAECPSTLAMCLVWGRMPSENERLGQEHLLVEPLVCLRRSLSTSGIEVTSMRGSTVLEGSSSGRRARRRFIWMPRKPAP